MQAKKQTGPPFIQSRSSFKVNWWPDKLAIPASLLDRFTYGRYTASHADPPFAHTCMAGVELPTAKQCYRFNGEILGLTALNGSATYLKEDIEEYYIIFGIIGSEISEE